MTDEELRKDLYNAICFYYPQYKYKKEIVAKKQQDIFVSDRFIVNLAAVVFLMPIGLLACVSASLFTTIQSIIYRA